MLSRSGPGAARKVAEAFPLLSRMACTPHESGLVTPRSLGIGVATRSMASLRGSLAAVVALVLAFAVLALL